MVELKWGSFYRIHSESLGVKLDIRVISTLREDNKIIYKIKVVDISSGEGSDGYLIKDNSKENWTVFTSGSDSLTVKDLKFQELKVFESTYKFLIIVGPSGGGKTYLESILLKDTNRYKNEYHKTTQVTTRESRGEDDPYLFASKSQYNKIKDKLVGRVNMDSKFGNYYGTLPIFSEESINTIILSEEGLLDFQKYIEENLDVEAVVAYVDTGSLTKRKDRDEDFIKDEKQLLKFHNFKVYPDDFTLNGEESTLKYILNLDTHLYNIFNK